MKLRHLYYNIVSDFELRISDLCRTYSTTVENLLQISSFLPNKPNFPHFSPENDDFAKKQTQFKPNQSQFWPKNQGGKAKQSQNKPNFYPRFQLTLLWSLPSGVLTCCSAGDRGRIQLSKVRFNEFVFNLIYKSRLLNWIKSWRFAASLQNCLYQYKKPAFIAIRIPSFGGSFKQERSYYHVN